MKICVLGNSHTASLKSAWDEIKFLFPKIELIFFAAIGGELKHLKLENGIFIPRTTSVLRSIRVTSHGIDSVDINAYDIFLLYGLNFFVPSLDHSITSKVKKLTCLDILSSSLIKKLSSEIRSESSKPIFIGHSPQLCGLSSTHLSRINKLNYTESLKLMRDTIGDSYGTIISQPEETLIHSWFTDPKFLSEVFSLVDGSNASGQLLSKTNIGHMNREFGRIWLEKFFTNF